MEAPGHAYARAGKGLWKSTWGGLGGHRSTVAQLQPMAADIEPGEQAAVEQVESERAALEAQDAGRDPDHQPAGVHPDICTEHLRVPGGCASGGPD